VLYAGHKVESGKGHTLRAAPSHPYTDLLVASVPELRRGWLEQVEPPPSLPPIGAVSNSPRLCSFLQRCPVRIDGVCNVTAPSHGVARDGKEILCHHSEEQLRHRRDPPPVTREVVRQPAAGDAK
jgi:peptide/nickel transport system ATP-binding protein